MDASAGTPVRLLPAPIPRTPQPPALPDEFGGVGLTFSLPERGAPDTGPVVAHVVPGSAADVDGAVRAGDRLLSVDGEAVRSWSMAKLRRVVASKEQVSLEVDRGGRKISTTLSRERPRQGGRPSPDMASSRLSLSSLAEPVAASVSILGASSTEQVERLQARCKVSRRVQLARAGGVWLIKEVAIAVAHHRCKNISNRSFLRGRRHSS